MIFEIKKIKTIKIFPQDSLILHVGYNKLDQRYIYLNINTQAKFSLFISFFSFSFSFFCNFITKYFYI